MIINTDKFRDTITVVDGDKSYHLELYTVQEYINGDIDSLLEKSPKDFCRSAVELLQSRSDIPREALELMTVNQLQALILGMRGIDPEKLIPDGDSVKK